MARLLRAAVVVLISCAAVPAQMRFSLSSAEGGVHLGEPTMRWTLLNRTSESWSVLAYFETPGMRHFDGVTIYLRRQVDGKNIRVPLKGRRSAARPHTALLQPGESLEQDFDVSLFDPTLEAGTYLVEAEYELTSSWSAAIPSVIRPWSGKLRAPSVRITIQPDRNLKR